MSWRTMCNYCSMKDYRVRAKNEGATVVTTRRSSMGGRDIYIVPLNEITPKPIMRDSEFHKKYWVSWQMAWSDHCVC